MLRRWGVTIFLTVTAYIAAFSGAVGAFFLYARIFACSPANVRTHAVTSQLSNCPYFTYRSGLMLITITLAWWALWWLHRLRLRAAPATRSRPLFWRVPLIVFLIFTPLAAYFTWLEFSLI